jgi:hypothetical protein
MYHAPDDLLVHYPFRNFSRLLQAKASDIEERMLC